MFNLCFQFLFLKFNIILFLHHAQVISLYFDIYRPSLTTINMMQQHRLIPLESKRLHLSTMQNRTSISSGKILETFPSSWEPSKNFSRSHGMAVKRSRNDPLDIKRFASVWTRSRCPYYRNGFQVDLPRSAV